MSDDLVAHLRGQCNRHVNGQCRVRRCMLRAGWKIGDTETLGTCEEWEAAAALEAKDAEIERLRSVLRQAVAVTDDDRKDALARIWKALTREPPSSSGTWDPATIAERVEMGVMDDAECEAEIAALKARLAAAEAALRPFAWAAEDLDDNESGELWERPAAMSIECANLRAAAEYFAALRAAQGEQP